MLALSANDISISHAFENKVDMTDSQNLKKYLQMYVHRKSLIRILTEFDPSN